MGVAAWNGSRVAVFPRLLPSSPCTEVLYEDDTVSRPEEIDPTRTLLGMLCGRIDDASFNKQVIESTCSLNRAMHGVAFVYLSCVLVVFSIADSRYRRTVSYTSCVLGVSCVLYVLASLSWDLITLLLRTFEFWFLFTVNALNSALWSCILRDERRFVMFVAAAFYATSLLTDANVYTRHLMTRVLAVASNLLAVVLVLTVLQLVPDAHNPRIHILGVAFDAVDLEATGSIIIGFFTTVRATRSQHLVFSSAPITRIQCEMYFPLCRLVPQAQRVATRRVLYLLAGPLYHSKGHQRRHMQQLQLVEEPKAKGIDVTEPLLYLGVTSSASMVRALNFGATVGLLCSSVTPLLKLGDPVLASTQSDVFFILEVVGFVFSVFYILICATQYQPTLTRRIGSEIDAWFVSFQTTLVAIALSDLFSWELRSVLVFWAAWLWGHWVIFLDALTPWARRRLALTRPIVLLAVALLTFYPMSLGYNLYSSSLKPRLRNRVVIEIPYRRTQTLHVDVLGFLASKLFTLWVWMGRFLWRELLRPPDAFRLIKRRVFYAVNNDTR